MAELLQWARERGAYVHPALQIAAPSGVRGVFTQESIANGETLVVLPKTAYLSPPSAESGAGSSLGADPLTAFFTSCEKPVSTFIQQALRILYEKGIGEKSILYPYISTLPVEFDLPIFWSDDEYEELRGTSIYEENRRTMRERFEQNVKPIMAQKPDLWPPSVSTFEEFRVASACVMSRGFHGAPGTGPFLLPIIDMINHDPDRVCTTLRWDGSAFRMTAERDIRIGSEIFHSYGQLGNSQLLHTYGFILEGNPYETFAISLNDLVSNYKQLRKRKDKTGLYRYDDYEEVIEIMDSSGDENATDGLESEDSTARTSQSETPVRKYPAPMKKARFCDARGSSYHVKKRRKKKKTSDQEEVLERKIKFLETFSPDLLESGSLSHQPTTSTRSSHCGLGVMILSLADPLSEELLTATQIIVMTTEEFEEYEQSPIPLGLDTMEEDYELASGVWQLLLFTIDQLNGRFTTTLSEDESLYHADGTSTRKRLALAVRMGQKAIIKALKRKVIVGMMRTQEDAESEEDSDFTGDEKEEEEELDENEEKGSEWITPEQGEIVLYKARLVPSTMKMALLSASDKRLKAVKAVIELMIAHTDYSFRAIRGW